MTRSNLKYRAILAFLLVVSVAFTASSAFGQDAIGPNGHPVFTVAERQNVLLLLTAHHELPGKDVFIDASPRARDLLLNLAKTSDSAVHQDRALLALGYWADADVYALYSHVIHAPATREGTRHRVMMRAADVFGESAVGMLKPALESADVQVRITAVTALGYVGSDSAYTVLDAHIAREESKLVIEALVKANRRVL